MDIHEKPPTQFCPAPDLTKLLDKILHLEKKDWYPSLDDGQINAFFHDKNSVLLNSKMLYQILEHEIQPLSKEEKVELHDWTNRDISIHNPDALPDFLGFATQVATYTLVQDEMLTYVKSVLHKYCQDGGIAPSEKKNSQLVKLFRTRFDNCMRSFPLSLEYESGDVVNPFSFPVVILFAVQIRSLFPPEEQLPRDVLLYTLVRIFTGCDSHWQALDVGKNHKAGHLPHNHIFFELMVVACGSMIDTFAKLDYLIISDHKSGGKSVQVNEVYTDRDGFMILPTYKDLLKTHGQQPCRSVSPDQVMSEFGSTFLPTFQQPRSSDRLNDTQSRGRAITNRDTTTPKSNSPPNKKSKTVQPKEHNDSDYIYDDDEQSDTDGEGVLDRSGLYNLGEGEFLPKELWKTPAACMEYAQRKNLMACYKTIQKMCARYSQRPGKDWPAQEFVLLQLTNINGVGQKKIATSHRKKTGVMAFGRPQGIAWYKSWLDSTTEGEGDFINHSTSNTGMLQKFWKTPEDEFSDTEPGTSSSNPPVNVPPSNRQLILARGKSTPNTTPGDSVPVNSISTQQVYTPRRTGRYALRASTTSSTTRAKRKKPPYPNSGNETTTRSKNTGRKTPPRSKKNHSQSATIPEDSNSTNLKGKNSGKKKIAPSTEANTGSGGGTQIINLRRNTNPPTPRKNSGKKKTSTRSDKNTPQSQSAPSPGDGSTTMLDGDSSGGGTPTLNLKQSTAPSIQATGSGIGGTQAINLRRNTDPSTQPLTDSEIIYLHKAKQGMLTPRDLRRNDSEIFKDAEERAANILDEEVSSDEEGAEEQGDDIIVDNEVASIENGDGATLTHIGEVGTAVGSALGQSLRNTYSALGQSLRNTYAASTHTTESGNGGQKHDQGRKVVKEEVILAPTSNFFPLANTRESAIDLLDDESSGSSVSYGLQSSSESSSSESSSSGSSTSSSSSSSLKSELSLTW